MKPSESTVNGLPLAIPRRVHASWLQVAEEIDARPANVAELLHMGSPGQAIGFRACGGNVLIEAGQRRVKAAGEPEGAHDEHPLRVVDVAE